MTTLDELVAALQIIQRQGHGGLNVAIGDVEPVVWPNLTGIRPDGTCAVRINWEDTEPVNTETCVHCGESITEGMVNDRAVYVDSIGAVHCEDNDSLSAHEPADEDEQDGLDGSRALYESPDDPTWS